MRTTLAARPNGKPTGDPILSTKDVRLSFGGVTAVDGASMEVEPGKITALIGPNGAGKTSFFNAVTGFYKANGGNVMFDGASIAGKAPDAIARRGLVRDLPANQVPRPDVGIG